MVWEVVDITSYDLSSPSLWFLSPHSSNNLYTDIGDVSRGRGLVRLEDGFSQTLEVRITL